MSKKIKKSRKAIHNYSFQSDEGTVEIDLNNFTAVCSVTGNPKKFYHSYLANLIATKYDNNITTFNNTYVSREGKKGANKARELEAVKARINKLYSQISSLKTKRDELATLVEVS